MALNELFTAMQQGTVDGQENPAAIIYDNKFADTYTVKTEGSYGLSNVAATVVNLLGYEAPEMWDESIIELK